MRLSVTAKKVEKAQGKVTSALNMFKKAHERVGKAQEDLFKAIAHDQAEIDKRLENQVKAKQAVEHNTTVLEKLADFIPQTNK